MKSTSRILVIEDEASPRRMLLHILERCGYEVVSAPTGELGVDKMKAEEFDAVVCDVVMPGIGGIAALKILKEISPETEVIMVTGSPNAGDVAECKKSGAFDYLFKPFEIEPFCATLDKAVLAKRAKSRGKLAIAKKRGKKLV